MGVDDIARVSVYQIDNLEEVGRIFPPENVRLSKEEYLLGVIGKLAQEKLGGLGGCRVYPKIALVFVDPNGTQLLQSVP